MGSYRKRTPEELERWEANQRRVEELIERRLNEQEGPAKRSPPRSKERQLENQRRVERLIERRRAQERDERARDGAEDP